MPTKVKRKSGLPKEAFRDKKIQDEENKTKIRRRNLSNVYLEDVCGRIRAFVLSVGIENGLIFENFESWICKNIEFLEAEEANPRRWLWKTCISEFKCWNDYCRYIEDFQ